MCGINGITESNQELVVRMNAVTKSRGPDGTNVRVFSECTLGHNRLSIIDTSNNASQPMTTSDGRYTIVFNGEIYNFKELRKELEGEYVFTSKGDTEVLLAAWSLWGEGVLSRLRGIFAFVIWDEKQQSLTAVRDQMGVKPFYYALELGKLIFSSELKGVLEGVKERRLNRAALGLYLGIQYVPSPETLVEGILKLPPGHLLTYKKGRVRVQRYYAPETLPRENHADIYTAIDTAVERQLVSDRSVGVFLSGGLDSSIVLHHMRQHIEKPHTFTVRFELPKKFAHQDAEFNMDANLAEETSRVYGTNHIELQVSLSEVREVICNQLTRFDEPIANPTAVTQYLLSQKTREHVVVALSGDGGDELFAGYPRHRIVRMIEVAKRLQVASLLAHRYPKATLPFGSPLHAALMAREGKVLGRILRKTEWNTRCIEEFFDAHYGAYRELSPLDAFMRVDRETWLPDESLLKLDKVSMAHGLEVRVPLLDLDVVALTDSIPATTNLPWWNLGRSTFGKKLLRDSYRAHLPRHLFIREKRGWISPGAKWLRDTEISAFVREVFSDTYYNGLSPVIDWAAVRDMYEEHITMKTYHLLPLWNLLLLQTWARSNRVTSS